MPIHLNSGNEPLALRHGVGHNEKCKPTHHFVTANYWLLDKNIGKCLLYNYNWIGGSKKPEMQIKKTYNEVKPELLYDEVRDFILKQGMIIGEAKLETYSLPNDSSSFISRGTLTFKAQSDSDKAGRECIRAHLIGSASGETKLMLDINEELFPQEKTSAFQEDLAFIFESYEVKPRGG